MRQPRCCQEGAQDQMPGPDAGQQEKKGLILANNVSYSLGGAALGQDEDPGGRRLLVPYRTTTDHVKDKIQTPPGSSPHHRQRQGQYEMKIQDNVKAKIQDNTGRRFRMRQAKIQDNMKAKVRDKMRARSRIAQDAAWKGEAAPPGSLGASWLWFKNKRGQEIQDNTRRRSTTTPGKDRRQRQDEDVTQRQAKI
ncbi:hypothetical protein NMY22_g6504 [Coprinellus aureogranulatus]|nr:hypothetical protein NMY22_g6504 [Coprinellus aureogranulatus]